MMKKSHAEIGRRIRLALRVSGKRQRVISEELGISPNSMSNYVRGERQAPIDVCARIARHCDVGIEWLISGIVTPLFGKSVEEKRLSIKKTREQLGISIAKPVSYITAIESAEIEPSEEMVLAIGKALGLNVPGLNDPLLLKEQNEQYRSDLQMAHEEIGRLKEIIVNLKKHISENVQSSGFPGSNQFRNTTAP